MRILDLDQRATPESAVEAHVALPESIPSDRAFVRLNMISSVDGGTAVGGVSGGLGNRDDHAVFAALREQADVCLVGLGTVVAEGYGVPAPPQLQLHVVCRHQRHRRRRGAVRVRSGHAGGARERGPGSRRCARAPGRRGPVRRPRGGVPRVGRSGRHRRGRPHAGRTPGRRGSPRRVLRHHRARVIAGGSARVAHGPDADASLWELAHGFLDDDGFLFLRYCRCL